MSAKTILIIDDDPNDLENAREILEMEGYTVHTHETAFGATSEISRIHPDLILLDLNMPGLTGHALSEILTSREETKTIPVVFYSSSDEHYLMQAVSRSGNTGYICKGDPSILKSRVKQFLLVGSLQGKRQ